MTDAVVPFLPQAYWVELIQLVLSQLGFVASLVGTYDAFVDLRFLRASKQNGHRAYSARQNLFEEYIRLTIHALLIYAGAVGVMYPPPNPVFEATDARYFPLVVVNRAVMATVSALLAVKSIQDIRYRLHLRKMLLLDRSS